MRLSIDKVDQQTDQGIVTLYRLDADIAGYPFQSVCADLEQVKLNFLEFLDGQIRSMQEERDKAHNLLFPDQLTNAKEDTKA